MNEAERRSELAERKARRDQREREARALDASGPTTYDITLENASKPGLPAPVTLSEKAGTALPYVATPSPDDLDETPSARSPSHDVILSEAERILADYVDLLAHWNTRTKGVR